MRLISPHNVTVSVSDSKGEALKKQGYQEAAVSAAPPVSPSPRKRAPRKKPTDD